MGPETTPMNAYIINIILRLTVDAIKASVITRAPIRMAEKYDMRIKIESSQYATHTRVFIELVIKVT